MLILNIETTTNICSVSLSKNGFSWIIKELKNTTDHAAQLTLFIDELFKISGLKLQDLDAIAVSSGPGSYTGLRIGVSVAKGLAYSLQKPLIAVDTLKSLAYGLTLSEKMEDGDVIVALQDARRMDAYAAVYSKNLEELKAPYFLTLEKDSFSEYLNGNNKVFICGNASEKFEEFIEGNSVFISSVNGPGSRYMEQLSAVAYTKSKFEDVAYFEPFYLKPPNVTKPKSLL